MTEQLKIVIEAVDKGATKTVNNLKQSLNSMNKSSGSGISKQMDAITVSANKASKATSALGKAFKAVGIAVGAIAVIKFGQNAIAQANKVESAFMGLQSILEGQGKSFNKAKGWLNEYVSDGLIPLSDATAAYKNLAARGYSTEQIQKSMIALKDAAAFGRQSSLSLGEAVSSATEGLKNENSMLVDNAGVTKNVAKMWDEYAKSIGKSTNELTQQEKITAEVNGLLKETQFQTGDAAKLAGTWQGQMAKLNAQWVTFSASIGAILKTVLTPLLGLLNGLLGAVNGFVGSLGNALKAITGKNPFEAMATSATNASTAVMGVGESATEAGDAAKKAAKNFGAFDELQVMDSGNSSTSTSTTGGGTTSFAPEVDVTEASKGLNKFEMAIKSTFEKVGQMMKDMWNTSSLQAFIGLAKSLLGGFVEIAVGIFDTLKGRISETFSGLSEPIGTIFASLNEILTNFFINFQVAWEENFIPIKDGIIGSVSAIYDSFDLAFSGIVIIVSEAFAIINEQWAKQGQTVADSIMKAVGSMWDTIQKFWEFVRDSIIEPIVSTMKNAWESSLKPIFEGFIEQIMKLWGNLADLWTYVLKPIVDWLMKSLAPTITIIFSLITGVFTSIAATIGSLINGALKMLNGIIEFLVGVFSGNWKKAWQGIKDIMSSVWSGITAIFKLPVNLIIDGLNAFIKAMNKIKIPDWVPGVGGKGINIDLIPKLAKGGIVDEGQMFIAGEAGKEAIMPLENNTGWITELASKLNGGTNNAPQNIQMNVDSRRFAEIVISSLNQYVTDTGNLPILLG